MRRGAGRGAWLAALAALTAACGRADAPARPSLLIVTIDTLRADAVGASGDPGGSSITPHIDALRRQGTSFVAASTVAPLTLPAHGSLLTGWRPARLGLTVNGVALPALPVETLAERAAAAGWATAAFVSSTVLDRRHGLAAGFQHYDDDLRAPGGPPAPLERRGDHTVDAALAWDGWDDERPCVGWVHLYDPHAPYAAPGGRHGEDLPAYHDEVRWADAQFGRLLDGVRARRAGPLLVVLTSDHGEGLGEHGEETHGLLLHEATMHVPLVFALYGADAQAFPAAGVERDEAVSLLDVTPTLLQLLDLPALPGTDGISLLTARRGRPLPLESRAPWFYYGFSPLAGVRVDGLKLVGAPRAADAGWRLHDLGADPRELAGEDGRGHALVAAVPSPDPEIEALPAGDPAALAALGYLGSRAPDGALANLPDPRAEMDLIVTLDRANSASVAGRPAEALARLATLGSRQSSVPEALLLSGRALAALGEHERACAELERAVALRHTPELLTEWGRALLLHARSGGGSAERAASVLDEALSLAADDPRATALRASVDLLLAEPGAALARIDAVLARRPDHVDLRVVKAQALRALGRADEADALERILQREFAQAGAPH